MESAFLRDKLDQSLPEQARTGQIDPGFASSWEQFIILAQASLTIQPGKGAFDHPAPGEQLKASRIPLGVCLFPQELLEQGRILTTRRHRSPHTDHTPAQLALDPLRKTLFVTLIRPEHLPMRKTTLKTLQQGRSPLRIRQRSSLDLHFQHKALRIHQHLALATFDLLASIIASQPPFSVVLTDWLSRIAARGWASRPMCCRTRSRSTVLSRSHVPSWRQRRKYQNTVLYGGKSCGNRCHAQPVLSAYKIALSISRRDHFAGLPPGNGGGTSGSRTAHSSSVTSVAYARHSIIALFSARLSLVYPVYTYSLSFDTVSQRRLLIIDSRSKLLYADCKRLQ